MNRNRNWRRFKPTHRGYYRSQEENPDYRTPEYDLERERRERGYESYYGSGKGYERERLHPQSPYYDYRGYIGDYDPATGHVHPKRTWWDRTTDEISAFFGDEEAQRRREYDRQMSHRGKGPKNYTRSDARILEDINERLSDDPYIDATDIEVSVNNGDVVLTGWVDYRQTKRRAEDIVEFVPGVKNVENRLRVKQFAEQPAGIASQSSAPIPGSNRGERRETGDTNR